MKRSVLLCVLLSLAFTMPERRSSAEQENGEKLFETRVLPVFKKHCFECHSTKAEELKGNLSLETLDDILKGGNNGAAVVPEDVENSFLLRAIRYQEADYQMPPDGRLPDSVIAEIEKWVELGAPGPRK